MENQIKLFNKQYLETRIREIKEIKRKEIKFDIEESDRAFSRSLYVNFYCQTTDSKWLKSHTLRISDHEIENCPHSQFIVDPSAFLSKKKKEQLMRNLEMAIKKAKTKSFYRTMGKIGKVGCNEED